MLSGAAHARAAREELPPPWLPLDPGRAACRVDANGTELTNAALQFAVKLQDKSAKPVLLHNLFAQRAQALDGELFTVTLREGERRAASQFVLAGKLSCQRVKANPQAARAAEHRGGVAVAGEFADPVTGLHVIWRAVLRDGTNYVREEASFVADKGVDLAAVAMIDTRLDSASIEGTADGSPLVAGDNFYGFEHPLANARVLEGRATMSLKRVLPLRAGVPVVYSAVLGVAPPRQLRRGFVAYLENERAAPFRTFLHYNSWYDIGYFTPYTETEAVAVIKAYGEELVRQRGVRMDSFLFDDGWDDLDHLWQFSKDFPQGFAPVRAAAEKFGAEPGMWLSPWGGYSKPRAHRLASAKTAGYEVDEQGLTLSGRKYYALFRDTTVNLLKRYAINQFKFDGTGSPDKVTPGSEFDSDFAAAIELIGDLRAIKPDLFVNLTTGTWPSPFWLRTADSIWRGGNDHEFAGVGSERQRWITYRDADTYGGIVRQGPLYPLNSLMLHGIIYARKAQGLNTDPNDDFADEVHSYFASGTGLQEMYISPDLLKPANWDVLAAAAKWARANAATLRDSHWIGGDPARGQVYGWAAWRPRHATIALRNPSDVAQEFMLDAAAALELPASEPMAWRTTPVFGSAESRVVQAGVLAKVTLRPFEVLVWELNPENAGR